MQDARAKIVAGSLLLVGLMVLPWGPALALAGLLALVGMVALRPPLRRIGLALAGVGWMLVIALALHGFTTPGHVLWRVPGLDWLLTVEGLERGGRFALRIGAVVLLGSGLSLSIQPLEGVRALDDLLRPLARLGLPVSTLTLVLGLALRFVPILYEEALTVRRAQLARGWSVGRGPIRRALSWTPVFVPVIAGGLRRGDDLADALLLKGYDPARRPTSLHRRAWSRGATLLLIAGATPWLVWAGLELWA